MLLDLLNHRVTHELVPICCAASILARAHNAGSVGGAGLQSSAAREGRC
jgi:hypothetical protein